MLAWWGPKVMARLYARALEAGIELNYVRGIIRRIGLPPPDGDCGLWPWQLKVYTLGRFSILRDEAPIRFSGKAQRKPLELLMALIALGGRDVPAFEVADSLWPDAEGDAAYRSLITTLQRLRHLLENPDAVVLSGNHLSVNRGILWVDCWAFERLSAKFRHRVLSRCQALEADGREADAIACYLRALEADERAEVFYDHLARLYRRLGRESRGPRRGGSALKDHSVIRSPYAAQRNRVSCLLSGSHATLGARRSARGAEPGVPSQSVETSHVVIPEMSLTGAG